MNIKTKLQSITYFTAIAVALLVVANYTFAWTGPSVAPTGGNVSAPINASSTGQIKDGGLSVGNTLSSTNLGFSVINGYSLFGTTTAPSQASGVIVTVAGNIGAAKYCDASGLNCFSPSNVSVSSIPSNIISTSTPGAKTWTAPAGVTRVKVRVWGGGGGGGSGKSSTNYIAAGGGAGGYSEAILTVTPGNTYNYTVGAGGAGSITLGINGSAGGSSNFNGTVVANGGSGGAAYLPSTPNSTPYPDTPGGTASGGNINLTGGSGSTGQNSNGVGGDGEGGNAPMGGQGGRFTGTAIGSNPYWLSEARVPGGGGSGGFGADNPAPVSGTPSGYNGASGMVVIEY